MPNKLKSSSEEPNTPAWTAWAAIAVGFLVVAIAVWMSSASQRTVLANATATAGALASQRPTSTTGSVPTVQVILTATLLPTAVPTPTPTSDDPALAPSPTPEGQIELAVVHSNDTWGYILPCG
jgi:hypothetical protein